MSHTQRPIAPLAAPLNQIESMLVINTGHLPEKEGSDQSSAGVSKALEQHQITGLVRAEGFVLSTHQHDNPAFNESWPVTAHILARAYAAGLPWMMFDRDAEALDDLPLYDW